MTIISIRIVVNVYNSLLHIYRVFLFFFVFEGDVAQIFFEAQLDRTSANLSRSPVQYFIIFLSLVFGGETRKFLILSPLLSILLGFVSFKLERVSLTARRRFGAPFPPFRRARSTIKSARGLKNRTAARLSVFGEVNFRFYSFFF